MFLPSFRILLSEHCKPTPHPCIIMLFQTLVVLATNFHNFDGLKTEPGSFNHIVPDIIFMLFLG